MKRLIHAGSLVLLLALTAYAPVQQLSSNPVELKATPSDCTIKQNTWVAFNENDFDKMIQYSVSKEYVLLQKMIDQQRIIEIKAGTKVILVDAGFTMHVVRPRNTEVEIYVVAEHLKCN